MHVRPWALFFVSFLLVSLASCSDDEQPSTPDSGVSPDAGTNPDGGPDPDGGTLNAAVDSYGRFSAGPTTAAISSGDLVLFGSDIAYLEGTSFDLDTTATVPRSGLVALDPSTGAARLFGVDDGLPEAEGIEGTTAAPIYDLDWIDRDAHIAVAAMWTHVARITVGESLAVTTTRLREVTATEDALVRFARHVGDAIYAGTDQGVVELDAETLAVRRWIALEDHPWVREAAAYEGGLIVIATPAGDDDAAVFVVSSGAAAVRVPFPAGRVHASALGSVNGYGLVVLHDAEGRADLWRVETNASEMVLVLDADRLAAAAPTPFVPARIAYDPVNARLLLGGRITIAGPIRTGGLAFVDAGEDGLPLAGAEARPAFDRRDFYTQLLPWEVSVMHVDALGRYYLAGWRLCSEHRAGVSGLIRVETMQDELRVVRPLLSGVRTIATGPAGETWLGLRDENQGLACFGVQVQQNVCRLRADGACEIYTPHTNVGDDRFAPSPGVAAIAFDDQRLAFATYRDATFFIDGQTARALATQLEPGLSLDMTSAAWTADGLWLGTGYSWDDLPGFPEDEIPKINARGPQGLGFVEIVNGRAGATRRYVRQASDLDRAHEEIGGLTSSNVRAVLALDDGRVLAGLAVERRGVSIDHAYGTVAPTGSEGGVALVDGSTVAAIRADTTSGFSDVVAFARYGEHVLALDARHGVFELDLAGRSATRVVAPAWSGTEHALSLAVNAAGRIAVGTSRAVYVLAGDASLAPVEIPHRVGWVWSVAFVANDVLLAGNDEGLARVRLGESAPALGPVSYAARDPWPLAAGCDGEDGCVCYGDDDCAPELLCACAGPSDCRCEAPRDPCLDAPGSAGCGCATDVESCDPGLTCDCSGERCVCAPDAATCALDCTCATQSGCPEGWHCEGGIAGFSCVVD